MPSVADATPRRSFHVAGSLPSARGAPIAVAGRAGAAGARSSSATASACRSSSGRSRPRSRARAPRPASSTRPRRARSPTAVGRVLAHRHAGGVPGHRGDPGLRRAHARRRRLVPHRARLHRLPRPARAAARRPQDAGRRRRIGRRIPRAEGLARQRQREPGLLARRPDPQRVGQGRRQLLAVARLRAGDRPRAPRRRRPHPRPRHARRLLRRLVAAAAAARGPERRAGQGRGGAAEAHVERGRADRQLPRHAAERMGGRAGVQLVRHLHGAVHPQATRWATTR